MAHSAAEVYAATEDQLRVELTGRGEVVDFEFPPAKIARRRQRTPAESGTIWHQG